MKDRAEALGPKTLLKAEEQPRYLKKTLPEKGKKWLFILQLRLL